MYIVYVHGLLWSTAFFLYTWSHGMHSYHSDSTNKYRFCLRIVKTAVIEMKNDVFPLRNVTLWQSPCKLPAYMFFTRCKFTRKRIAAINCLCNLTTTSFTTKHEHWLWRQWLRSHCDGSGNVAVTVIVTATGYCIADGNSGVTVMVTSESQLLLSRWQRRLFLRCFPAN